MLLTLIPSLKSTLIVKPTHPVKFFRQVAFVSFRLLLKLIDLFLRSDFCSVLLATSKLTGDPANTTMMQKKRLLAK